MANKKISELPLRTALALTDTVTLVAGGINYQGTLQAVASLLDTYVAGAAGALRFQQGLSIFNTSSAQQASFGHGTQVVGSASNQAGDATNPFHQLYQTAASAGSFAGNGTGALFNIDHNLEFSVLFKPVSITACRYWIGLVGTTIGNMNADNPAQHFAAFRWSTDASDAFWRCITKDGTTANNQSSGVAMDADWQTFSIKTIGAPVSEIQFFINGVLVATSDANLPLNTQTLRFQFAIESRAAAAKDIRGAMIQSRHVYEP